MRLAEQGLRQPKAGVLYALLLISGCASPSAPAWWLRTPDGQLRSAWLGKSLTATPLESGSPPHYADSLGRVFRYLPPLGGVLWIEYYAQQDTICSITLTWEHTEFAALAKVYQELRTYYTHIYASPQGPPGKLRWHTSDSLEIRLWLSPEKRYLHNAWIKK
ncbi:MAG: hypothetical protein NZ958_06130 [Bacteroidia bacterium]|nr:hypothetical protein [Bacteroidia bacterium]MDW8088803.1 hypothetical protein [Bacteroidia bacterium]